MPTPSYEDSRRAEPRRASIPTAASQRSWCHLGLRQAVGAGGSDAGRGTIGVMRRLCLPIIAAVLTLVAGCTRSSTDMTAANKDLVRRYLEDVFNTGDVDQLPDIVAPDYVEVVDGQVHAIGIEGARAHVLGIRAAFPDLRIAIDQQIAEGDWVVSQITVTGTHLGDWLGMAATGKPMTFTGVNVNRVSGGRIVEHGGAANLFGPLLEAGAIQKVGAGDSEGPGS